MADTEKELDIELIKKKAISGVITFTLRTFFIQAFTFLATFILTVLLAPEIFGIFFVVSAILNFFVYFSDVGLAAALVQKKEKPTRADLVSTFTIQQLIVVILVTAGLILSSKFAHFYNLDKNGLLLLRFLIFSLILSSLKTIPSIILERELEFKKLVIPQIAENIVFYSTALVLAYLNFQVASFAWAVLVRGVTGLVLIYLLSPWRPSLGINLESAKKLIRFGIPFQVNSILALLKDDLLTVFLGKILTFTQVGYIGWSQKWAFVPLRFFMDNVNKVTFPAFSRLQSHTQELAKSIEKALFFVTYFVYPSIFGMVAIAPVLIAIIPKYQKWEPALPLLYLFAINVIFSAVSTTFTNVLFALGKPKIVLNFMIFWTIATWFATYPLVKILGFVGVGIASALVASTSLATIYFASKEVKVKIGSNVFGPLIASAVMFLYIQMVFRVFGQNIYSATFAIFSAVIIYFMTTLLIFRDDLKENVATMKGIFLKGIK